MRMVSPITLQKKDEPLLPQTIETPVEDNPEQVKMKVKEKVSASKTKKKFLAGASSVLQLVLFTVLWIAPGRIVTVLCTAAG